jgi:fatty-acid desaturase
MVSKIIKQIFHWTPTWGAWLPVQFFGILAIYNILTGSTSPYWWIYTIIGYFLFSVIGISIGYHRYLSHKSFKTRKIYQRIMLWCGVMAAQGTPIFWAIIHRGYHHKHTDTDLDPHSPRHGFWHSYLGWLFKIRPVMNTKYVLDLMKNQDVFFAHKNYFTILWISNILLLTINVDLWLYGVMLPCFLSFHAYATNTSINHCKALGYQRYKLNNDSTNVIVLWPLLFGDAWHNNHHNRAADPNFGKSTWELDPAFWIIKLIRSD